MQTTIPAPDGSKRLLSLDVMRGMIMLLLAAESCAVYESLNEATTDSFVHPFMQQFFHHQKFPLFIMSQQKQNNLQKKLKL